MSRLPAKAFSSWQCWTTAHFMEINQSPFCNMSLISHLKKNMFAIYLFSFVKNPMNKNKNSLISDNIFFGKQSHFIFKDLITNEFARCSRDLFIFVKCITIEFSFPYNVPQSKHLSTKKLVKLTLGFIQSSPQYLIWPPMSE